MNHVRTLVSIERNMAQYFSSADSFKASLADLANVLSLCMHQEDETAQSIPLASSMLAMTY